jgi:SPP1 family predicted phage head-tail adaptor
MRIGKLRNLVTIQRPVAGEDAIGQPDPDFEFFCQAFADIRYQSGLEAVKSAASVSVSKASIRIRFRDDITAHMRVVAGSTTFDVQAVLPDIAKRAYVDLICEVVL